MGKPDIKNRPEIGEFVRTGEWPGKGSFRGWVVGYVGDSLAQLRVEDGSVQAFHHSHLQLAKPSKREYLARVDYLDELWERAKEAYDGEGRGEG